MGFVQKPGGGMLFVYDARSCNSRETNTEENEEEEEDDDKGSQRTNERKHRRKRRGGGGGGKQVTRGKEEERRSLSTNGQTKFNAQASTEPFTSVRIFR